MSALYWEIKSNDQQNQIDLKGDLTRLTLFPLWQQRQQVIERLQTKSSSIVWNLVEIQHIDSAGFAFLCELLIASRKIGITVKIIQFPTQCETLAELFDLTEVFRTFL